MNILEVSAKLNVGGAQAVAANISRYADDHFHFVYLVFGDEVGAYEPQILARGDRVLHIPAPDEGLFAYLKNLIRIIHEEHIDVVHAHTMHNCGLVMLAAKLANVPGRISHSHTIRDETGNGLPRRLYRRFMTDIIRVCGTDWCACGVEAGINLYGERWFRSHGVVIRNGIDVDAYAYRESARQRIREELGLKNAFVLGHVGHYVKAKNQTFLIHMMPELLKRKPNAVLLLFGEGEDRGRLQTEIDQLGLTSTVRLMGNSDRIGEILSALDVFVFPSLYEGTPLALIEAQANLLPCVVSSAVPDDACLTDAVVRRSLDAPVSEWIEAILLARRVAPDVVEIPLRRQYGTIRSTMEELYDIFRKYEKKGKQL